MQTLYRILLPIEFGRLHPYTLADIEWEYRNLDFELALWSWLGRQAMLSAERVLESEVFRPAGENA